MGPKQLYLAIGWFGLVGPAVAAMALGMYVSDDPNASAGSTVFMAALGLSFAALALFLAPCSAVRSSHRNLAGERGFGTRARARHSSQATKRRLDERDHG